MFSQIGDNDVDLYLLIFSLFFFYQLADFLISFHSVGKTPLPGQFPEINERFIITLGAPIFDIQINLSFCP